MHQSNRSLSALGDFRKLPDNIRAQIWEYLMPHHREAIERRTVYVEAEEWFEFGPDAKAYGVAAILRSSHRLYVEVSAKLYHRDLCIQFCIDSPETMKWTVKDLPGATSRDFVFANFARFKKIIFEIQNPEKHPTRTRHPRIFPPSNSVHALTIGKVFSQFYDDLRDILATIMHITQCFVHAPSSRHNRLLRRSANLPVIDIVFLEDKFTSWTVSGMPKKLQSDVPRSNIEYCLQLFADNIRGAAWVDITLPTELKANDQLAAAIMHTKNAMTADTKESIFQNRTGRPLVPDTRFLRTTTGELGCYLPVDQLFLTWYCGALRDKVL